MHSRRQTPMKARHEKLQPVPIPAHLARFTNLKGKKSLSPGLPALRSRSSEALLAKEGAFLPSVGSAKEGDEGGQGYPGISGETGPTLKGLHQDRDSRFAVRRGCTLGTRIFPACEQLGPSQCIEESRIQASALIAPLRFVQASGS